MGGESTTFTVDAVIYVNDDNRFFGIVHGVEDKMQRYAEALNALNTALNLMVEEGDTLLVASISHPLHMAESQLMLRRAEKLTAAMAGRQAAQNSGTTTQTSQ